MNSNSNGGRRGSLFDLESLGIGPDSVLMRDSKLFVDSPFLSTVLNEFEEAPEHRLALFQIGANHGIRDARKVLQALSDEVFPSNRSMPGTPPLLPMQLGPMGKASNQTSAILRGQWPEAHEARARLAGPGSSDIPSCYLSMGYTSGWLSEIHAQDLVVSEVSCVANGAPECRFEARSGGEPKLENSPLASLGSRPQRDSHERELDTPPVAFSSLDPGDNEVRVWGPVMVLPFTTPVATLSAVRGLARELGSVAVASVIINLRKELVDREPTLICLEKILKIIESWRAEAIATGLSEGNREIGDWLASRGVLTNDDLAEAIPLAFQIACAQRHNA
jgi:hypothetical protein